MIFESLDSMLQTLSFGFSSCYSVLQLFHLQKKRWGCTEKSVSKVRMPLRLSYSDYRMLEKGCGHRGQTIDPHDYCRRCAPELAGFVCDGIHHVCDTCKHLDRKTWRRIRGQWERNDRIKTSRAGEDLPLSIDDDVTSLAGSESFELPDPASPTQGPTCHPATAWKPLSEVTVSQALRTLDSQQYQAVSKSPKASAAAALVIYLDSETPPLSQPVATSDQITSTADEKAIADMVKRYFTAEALKKAKTQTTQQNVARSKPTATVSRPPADDVVDILGEAAHETYDIIIPPLKFTLVTQLRARDAVRARFLT